MNDGLSPEITPVKGPSGVRVNPDLSVWSGSEMLLPPRVPCVSLRQDDLHPEDREFLANNVERANVYQSLAPQRQALKEKWPANLVISYCMDGREQDTPESLGVPPGCAKLLKLAGAKIGWPNGRIRKYFLSEVGKAEAEGRQLMYLEIMHHSSNGAGCAAWQGDFKAAHQYSIHRTIRFNEGLLTSPDGVAPPPHIFFPIPITSDTYTKARVWHGPGGKVDPMSFVQRDTHGGDRTLDPAAHFEGDDLRRALTDLFKQAFPLESPLFAYVDAGKWDKLISQMTDMCFTNVGVVRERHKTGFAEYGDIHKEHRVFIGRGFDMYPEPDQQLVISDFNVKPDVNESATLGLGFALANRMARFIKDPSTSANLEVPVYISIPYNQKRTGEFGTAAAHAEDLSYSLMVHLRSIHENLVARTQFREQVEKNLKNVGVVLTDLSGPLYKQCDMVLHEPFKSVRIVELLCDDETLVFSPRRVLRWSDYDTMELPSNA